MPEAPAKPQDKPTTSAKTLQPASPAKPPSTHQPSGQRMTTLTTPEGPRIMPVEDDAPAAPAPAHPRGAKKATVYPVEFTGYVTRDVNEQPVKVTETEEGGQKWEAHDPRDVPRAQRDSKAGKPREPNPHPTRRIRFYYREDDTARFFGLPGFKLHPPQEHRLKTTPVLATTKPEA